MIGIFLFMLPMNLYLAANSSLHEASVANITQQIVNKAPTTTALPSNTIKTLPNTHDLSKGKVDDSTTSPITTSKCKTGVINNKELHMNKSCYSPEDAMKCFHDPIFCEKSFDSGLRDMRVLRPAYGEYSYLEHNKWFYVIQHGGIAFLFHPCTDSKEVDLLRSLATECLHRHVIAPYHLLSPEMPVALVSWGCYLMSSKFDIPSMKEFIQEHALNGPASHVTTNGQYKNNLVRHSGILTDKKDSFPCPTLDERSLFSTVKPQPPTGKFHNRNPHERIILQRIDKAQHKRDKTIVNISANITVTKVEAGSAAWAASSLFFLCGILVFWLIYTKFWTHSKMSYKYKKLNILTDDFEYTPAHTDFSLLKSDQKFVSIFKKEKRKDDSSSKIHLMRPIDEEDEDEL